MFVQILKKGGGLATDIAQAFQYYERLSDLAHLERIEPSATRKAQAR
jgi:hypothetical protein